MSRENVELIRRGFAAFEQGDLSQMLDLFADDLVTYRADPDGATFHGKEGFLEATADWTEGFSDWSAVPEEFIDAGDFALARVRQIARGASSRISVEGDFWFVFEVHGTKFSKAELLQQPRRCGSRRCRRQAVGSKTVAFRRKQQSCVDGHRPPLRFCP